MIYYNKLVKWEIWQFRVRTAIVIKGTFLTNILRKVIEFGVNVFHSEMK